MMLRFIEKIKRAKSVFLPTRKSLGSSGSNTHIEFPVYISYPKNVFIESDTRIRIGTKILISENDTLTIKKYTVISVNCVIVTNKHNSTVCIPQILLGISGINDQHNNLVIEEDVWIGANVTIMGNANLGRGCICGACSTITKPVPPYALVVGSPAKIVGVKFSIDQILEHEKVLYPENERFSREYLEKLFADYYQDKRVFGLSTEFTEEQIERLWQCAQSRKYTDMSYFDRIKSKRCTK